MKSPPRVLSAAAALMIVEPAVAWAGMPSITLSEVARLRVQSISFFLLGLLLSAGLIQLVWNWLAKDFPRLPRLGYGKALGVVTLWSLLFVLVLTMISGARELLTPGAWEKQGSTYRLVKESPASPTSVESDTETMRHRQMAALRRELWEYAQMHGGNFPPDRTVSAIASERWQLPDNPGLRYFYVAGLRADEGNTPLAYEPGIYGSQRLVLFTSGAIKMMNLEDVVQATPGEHR